MRKVTRTIARAFYCGDSESCGNTRTDGKSVWLHGNKIAFKDEDGNLHITNAGYETNVTKERLNGLLELGNFPGWPSPRIFAKNFRWHLELSGSFVKFPCNVWVSVVDEFDKAQKGEQYECLG